MAEQLVFPFFHCASCAQPFMMEGDEHPHLVHDPRTDEVLECCSAECSTDYCNYGGLENFFALVARAKTIRVRRIGEDWETIRSPKDASA